jgi:hypothetical protein
MPNKKIVKKLSQHDSLNANNISARINLLGDNFNDFVGNPKFEAPKNSNKHTIYTSAQWVGNKNYKSGIAETKVPAETLNLYPNPANTNISVLFGNASVKKIVIIDNMGREVARMVPGKSETQVSVDIAGLANGMYTVSAETNAGVSNAKLVIRR